MRRSSGVVHMNVMRKLALGGIASTQPSASVAVPQPAPLHDPRMAGGVPTDMAALGAPGSGPWGSSGFNFMSSGPYSLAGSALGLAVPGAGILGSIVQNAVDQRQGDFAYANNAQAVAAAKDAAFHGVPAADGSVVAPSGPVGASILSGDASALKGGEGPSLSSTGGYGATMADASGGKGGAPAGLGGDVGGGYGGESIGYGGGDPGGGSPGSDGGYGGGFGAEANTGDVKFAGGGSTRRGLFRAFREAVQEPPRPVREAQPNFTIPEAPPMSMNLPATIPDAAPSPAIIPGAQPEGLQEAITGAINTPLDRRTMLRGMGNAASALSDVGRLARFIPQAPAAPATLSPTYEPVLRSLSAFNNHMDSVNDSLSSLARERWDNVVRRGSDLIVPNNRERIDDYTAQMGRTYTDELERLRREYNLSESDMDAISSASGFVSNNRIQMPDNIIDRIVSNRLGFTDEQMREAIGTVRPSELNDPVYQMDRYIPYEASRRSGSPDGVMENLYNLGEMDYQRWYGNRGRMPAERMAEFIDSIDSGITPGNSLHSFLPEEAEGTFPWQVLERINREPHNLDLYGPMFGDANRYEPMTRARWQRQTGQSRGFTDEQLTGMEDLGRTYDSDIEQQIGRMRDDGAWPDDPPSSLFGPAQRRMMQPENPDHPFSISPNTLFEYRNAPYPFNDTSRAYDPAAPRWTFPLGPRRPGVPE